MTGTFITTLPDGTKVNDQILVEKRGHFRSDFLLCSACKTHIQLQGFSQIVFPEINEAGERMQSVAGS
ncbi:MAG: hypothetical protein WDM78_22965 [Puia sp.]